jgi:DNA-binding response OmpR family regulator
MATILLVEDEPALAQIIIETLEKNGYQVLHAANGQAALKLLQQRQPDITIMDWALFALGGVERLYALRRASPAPVLMLTARDAESNRLIDIEFNADDYLAKPFSRSELTARVRALLHRAERVQKIVGTDRERRTQSLAYQNLALDAVQRRVTIDGHPVDLSFIEFELLSLMMSSPGRTFSSTYLLETVWKEAEVGENLTLDTIMTRLGEKLGTAGTIEKVFGTGYRLKPVR